MFKLIKTMDCSLEVVVGRKMPSLFLRKHHGQESEFYADLLSHLLKTKLRQDRKLVLNIAERGPSTKERKSRTGIAEGDGPVRQEVGRVGNPVAGGVQCADAAHRAVAERGGLFVLGGAAGLRARRDAAL